ncbi:MAG: glycosyltransferase family 4 protein [Microbacterium sp.]|uniref:glycosyltransferase family 4 protein n=1 Tax=Microbacterium sp. TaxID=51671 RepID=UPI0026322ABA|nr:glycosyltransferase family 4 protein [Microbacterium sp.]MCX6501603.1 glycosyltransferase family 4 protein [Microbacterium sp.]
MPDDERGRNYGAPVGALCTALLRVGLSVTVITHERGLPGLTLRGPRINFIRVASRASPKLQIADFFAQERRAMKRAALAIDADVVHAHWTYEWQRVALDLGLPMVVTIHDAPWTVFIQNRGPYWALRALHSLWNRVRTPAHTQLVGVSHYVSDRWKRQHVWPGDVQVIPNVVEVEVDMEDLHQDRGVVGSEAFLLEIADSSRRKRSHLLAARYARLGLPWVMEFAGKGLDESFRARVAKRAELPNIRMRGPLARGATMKRLAQARAHVHASAEESFGLTVVESLILGVPVVVDTKSGGAAENLKKYNVGVTVDFRRARDQELTAAISQAIEGAPLVRQMAPTVRSEHSGPTVAARYIKVYRRAIASSSALARRSE